MSERIPLFDSPGKVVGDPGARNADESLVKSALSAHIFRILEQRKLTQVATGELLGLSQPKVSAILSGRFEGCSTGRLLRYLARLGCDIQIDVSTPHPGMTGRIRVLAR